jgi:lipopolysaccharide assembly outer membrane protein LptD (OstA)
LGRRFFISILTVCLLCALNLQGQNQADSLASMNVVDSAKVSASDTAQSENQKKKKSIVDSPVHYSAKDSMTMVFGDKMVYLYGKGNIKYEDFDLTSDYVESDLNNNEVTAKGVSDSANKYNGKPIFKQREEEFESDSLKYNLKTGKGVIHNVITEQGEGYLHSTLTKRDNEGHIHVKGGKYTTCNAEHPHFYMELTKAIVIPEEKIVSGPAYLIIEDVPIPVLGLPFGFFPNSKKRGAGILLPQYKEEANRGFCLEDFGWYQPFGQHVDMQVLGQAYSKGSWGVRWGSNYKWRYKFNGSMRIDYNNNVLDGKDRTDDDAEFKKDFRWTWSHRQDAKANPTQSFSANVNFSSSGFDRNNASTTPDYLTNQKSSSISYSKNWPGTPFNLSLSANARQNTQTKTVDMDLPTGSFNASTIYPFRKKNSTGKSTWYQDILDNIGFSYSSKFAGKVEGVNDTMIFYKDTWTDMNKGFSHTIPFVINLKSKKVKMVTVSPSLSYQGRLYDFYITKRVESSGINDEPVIVTDTVRQMTYAQAINPGISIGLTPKITGMFQNTRPDPKLIAVRHVMQPKASFSFVPDMSRFNPNYYDTLYYMKDGKRQKETYSYFEKNMYGTPSSAGRSGRLSLGLSNTLDAKVKAKNDSTGDAEPEKVSLIRNFNISTSYNPFADEFKWNDVSVNAGTQLFNNKLNIQVTNSYSLYDFKVDSSGNSVRTTKVDEFYYSNGKGLMRFTRIGVTAGLTLRSEANKKEDEEEEEEDEQYNMYQDPMNPDYEFVPGYSAINGSYVDFSVPWSLRLNYNWTLNRPFLKEDQTITHTLGLSGDFSLTPKWKIGFNSGYDFESKKITFTNLSIHRDLHCWEMNFSVVPFGDRRNYGFYIRAKSSILRDLKVDKKKNWRDTF